MTVKTYGVFDAIVVGGTMAGIVASSALAESGLRTVLVIRGTSPGYEHTAYLQPWVSRRDLESAPAFLREFYLAACDERVSPIQCEDDGDSIMFHLGNFARLLEDHLLDRKVELVYSAVPVAVLQAGDRIGGLLVGGKFGVQALTAPLVVDCSAGALLARTCGTALRFRRPDDLRLRYVLQRLVPGDSGTAGTDVPADSGGNGSHSSFEWYDNMVRLTLPVAEPPRPASLHADMERIGRLAAIDAVQGMRRDRPDLVFLRGAERVQVRPAFRIADEIDRPEEGLVQCERLPGLVIVGAAAATTEQAADEMADHPLRFVSNAMRVPALRHDAGSATGLLSAVFAGCAEGVPDVGASDFRLHDPAFSEPGVHDLEIDMRVPARTDQAELVVAGGGTSGFGVALEAARSGVRTICVESHGVPGGVNTSGGVPYYWFGRWNRHFRGRFRELRDLVRNTGLPTGLAQLSLLSDAGVRFMPCTSVCGVRASGKRIDGIFVAGDDGSRVVEGDLYVDATGDGDLAAWTGVQYSYGVHRDEMTMWSSVGGFSRSRREASRQYHTAVDQRSSRDATRVIVGGRRLPGIYGEFEYPLPTMATRESRHIAGHQTVTYLDVLTGRKYADALVGCTSNIDIKGMASSAATMCGFVERDFLRTHDVEVPLGAILPLGPENLLVVGKAYSATHDALSMARMQADMASLGAAAGIVAGAALESAPQTRGPNQRASFTTVDAGVVRDRLLTAGLLDAEDVAGVHNDGRPSGEEIETLCDRLVMGPIGLAEQAKLLGRPDITGPILRDTIDSIESPSGRLIAARILAVFRDPAAAPHLLSAIDAELQAQALPEPFAAPFHSFPDHGWAPDLVYYLNAASRTGDPRVAERLAIVADRAYAEIDQSVSDHRFAYVHGISYAAEQLATTAMQPVLTRLLQHPALHDGVIPRGGDPREAGDPVRERFAYLELCLMRALARSGAEAGYHGLISYLVDIRLYLARSALRELCALTGERGGFEQEYWRSVVTGRGHEPAPVPLCEGVDWCEQEYR